MTTKALARQVLKQAERCGKRLTTAESCTAGALALALSKAPGAGDHFQGGFVTYTKEMKSVMLGVPKALLLKQGAVCRAVAVRMAQGALRRARADVAAAVTGVAGPEPDEDGNPVGLVYCCVVARGRKPRVKRRRFGGSQAAILKGSVEEALRLLKKACR